jgi:pimeloyl-ACP methyl ester carboxylesterase
MMSVRWSIPQDAGGVLHAVNHSSELLKSGARLEMKVERQHLVFDPTGLVGQNPQAIQAVTYVLPPWLSGAKSLFQWEPFKEGLAERVMRLYKAGEIPATFFVVPDLWTDFGGSQFVDSEGVGPHGTCLVEEIFPGVESLFGLNLGPKRRVVVGRSSGGFGALRLAMDFDQSCGAVACHAGDMGFEWVYRRSLIDLCTGLVKYAGPREYIEQLKKQNKVSGFDMHCLMLLGMAAFYSPNPNSELGYDLPIDLKSGAVKEDVYGRWLQHDPLVRVQMPGVSDKLRNLKMLFIDCGNKDQYFLQYGSRQLVQKLKTLGISHEYQEFDDNHSGTNYRYDVSLPKLLKAVTKS